MPYPQFDRARLKLRPLAERRSLLVAEKVILPPESVLERPPEVGEAAPQLLRLAERIRRARDAGASVVLAFGAHAIKNGLALVMLRLAEEGWVTHFATNGAGSIHDWEFAFLGATSEDVRANVATGSFGLWEETGRLISLAVAAGALEHRGYGESVGRLIESERLVIPAANSNSPQGRAAPPEQTAMAAELAEVVATAGAAPGQEQVPHRWKKFSLQAGAFRLGVPFTVHPGIGYDIIYTHPAASGAVFGRAAYRDFLSFAEAVRRLSGGVYLSAGSAIMSPMIFEKSLSMAQNVALQAGQPISGHTICVNDLAPSNHDWRLGEPASSGPSYYLRYCKTFTRMGGQMEYVFLDNRAFLGRLYAELHQSK
jgi:hypothetical protein